MKFDANGLIPAIVRDARSGAILTLAYMNEESLARTRETGETWFWSRSRNELWHKGATSGHTQQVIHIAEDCDEDALVVSVIPHGPACHTGASSCFAGIPARPARPPHRPSVRRPPRAPRHPPARLVLRIALQRRPRQDPEEGERRGDGGDHRQQVRRAQTRRGRGGGPDLSPRRVAGGRGTGHRRRRGRATAP